VIRDVLAEAPQGLRQQDLIDAVRRAGWPGYTSRRLLDDDLDRQSLHRLPARAGNHDTRWYDLRHYDQALAAYLHDRSQRKHRRPAARREERDERRDRPLPATSVFDFARRLGAGT
jgi:hypothetical protein